MLHALPLETYNALPPSCSLLHLIYLGSPFTSREVREWERFALTDDNLCSQSPPVLTVAVGLALEKYLETSIGAEWDGPSALVQA